MQDVSQGAERTRAWPRKRTAAEKAKTAEQNEWFRQVQWASKYIAPGTMKDIMNARKGTPFLPRDIFMMQMAGTMCSFVTPNGRRIHSMATYQAVSESLDAITQFENYLLMRGPEGWIGVPYSPSHSPWWWSPPPLDGWTFLNGTGWDLSLEGDEVRGVSAVSGAPVSGDRLALAAMPIPSKNNAWTMYFHHDCYIDTPNASGLGLYIRNSLNGRIMSIAARNFTPCSVDKWSGLVGHTGTGITVGATQLSQITHYKIEFDEVSVAFFFSADAVNWQLIHTEGIGTFLLGPPDQIAFGMDYNRASARPNMMNVNRWVFEQV